MNWLFALIAVGVLSSVDAAGPTPSRRDADQLKQKISTITQRAANSASRPARTTVTEREVNAYLLFEAADDFPAGIVDPRLSIQGADRVTGSAVVDLDRVRAQLKPTSLLDPANLLRGRLAVSVTGLVSAKDGIGRFEFQEADIAGVPVPKFVVQQIVSYYSRSVQRPSGLGLDDPVALPSGIREIRVERGQAVIVQ